jgi:hypothetical protein
MGSDFYSFRKYEKLWMGESIFFPTFKSTNPHLEKSDEPSIFQIGALYGRLAAIADNFRCPAA